MLEITNLKVYDLIESVIASGNAMRIEPIENLSSYTEADEEFKKGIQRMIRLNKASKGDVKCHNHALCGIRVAFDVKYPQYWTPEFQRYNFADIVTSSSKMHRLCKMDLIKACNKYVDPRLIAIEQEKVDAYNELLEINKKVNFITSGVNTEEAIYIAFMAMISNCPLGLELFMRVNTNYLELQNIYFQRRNHKLKEDWGAFCSMIEKLPYFQELILGKDNEKA